MTQEEFFNRYKYDRTKDRIGGGGFGNVYKVFDTIENETVALKIAEVKQGQESLSLLKEVELASSLKRHVNIARYTACYRFDLPNGHFDFGILQYYPLGNLSQLVKTKKLSYEEKEQIAQGVISGIQHLHNNNIVHRDLKSANILIAQGYHGEYVPKIADFGLSKQFAQNENSYFSNSFAGGSLLYVAPEQLEGKELRKNVDLWSLGVVLYELFAGETPFRANVDDGSETARAEIISKIKNASIPKNISCVPYPWVGIIQDCLVADPLQRIKSIGEVEKKAGMYLAETFVDPLLTTPADQEPLNTPILISKWKFFLIGCVILLSGLFLIMRSNFTRETEDVYQPQTNDEFLLSIYDKLELSKKGTFELFKMDMVLDEILAKKVYDKLDLSKKKSFEQFKIDIGFEGSIKLPSAILANQEGQVWKDALSKDIESAYARYLFLYPDGKYVKEAKKRMVDFEIKPNKKNSFKRPSINMISIPGRNFKLSETEVTIGQYLAFCKETNSHWPKWLEKGSEFNIYTGTNKVYKEIGMKESNISMPITGVTYQDAIAFCEWIGGRLPTKLEWEYAAFGGQEYKYAGSNNYDEIAWYGNNSNGRCHEVGKLKPNGFGLYDMSGNVAEWTSNKSEFVDNNIYMGGSWGNYNKTECNMEGHPAYLKSDVNIGFRLAN